MQSWVSECVGVGGPSPVTLLLVSTFNGAITSLEQLVLSPPDCKLVTCKNIINDYSVKINEAMLGESWTRFSSGVYWKCDNSSWRTSDVTATVSERELSFACALFGSLLRNAILRTSPEWLRKNRKREKVRIRLWKTLETRSWENGRIIWPAYCYSAGAGNLCLLLITFPPSSCHRTRSDFVRYFSLLCIDKCR